MQLNRPLFVPEIMKSDNSTQKSHSSIQKSKIAKIY